MRYDLCGAVIFHEKAPTQGGFVKVVKKLLTLAVMLAVVAGAFSMVSAQEGIESACLVTDVGKVDDGTFNELAFDGLTAAGEDFDLETTYIETLASTDYAINIQRCIDSDFDAIITVGFLMQDATLAAATDNPDVYFIGIDQGYEMPPANLVGVQFREDQSGFLVGALAAQMTESDIIAGVYGMPVPAVVKFRNGFEQGAKYINPDIDVRGVYIQSFTDSVAGGETADQLISEGADVIFGAGGQTGSGGILRAAQQGVYVIGVDKDEYLTTFGAGETPGAEFLISSAMKRVDQGVYQPLEALVEGNMEGFGGGGTLVLSAANDGVTFAPAHDSDVPEEVTASIEEILVGLQDGTIETGVDPVSGELMGMEEMTPEATEEA
jgi:basic membrane lipoprotein Med (substrate-binding protein (PBP1-ABC) superfamily)